MISAGDAKHPEDEQKHPQEAYILVNIHDMEIKKINMQSKVIQWRKKEVKKWQDSEEGVMGRVLLQMGCSGRAYLRAEAE